MVEFVSNISYALLIKQLIPVKKFYKSVLYFIFQKNYSPILYGSIDRPKYIDILDKPKVLPLIPKKIINPTKKGSWLKKLHK